MALASIHRHHHSLLLRRPIATLRPFSNRLTSSLKFRTSYARTISVSGAASFNWDDVHRVSQPEYASEDDSSDLTGFFRKVRNCNRGMVKFDSLVAFDSSELLCWCWCFHWFWIWVQEFRVEFLPFVVEDQVVGFVHDGSDKEFFL